MSPGSWPDGSVPLTTLASRPSSGLIVSLAFKAIEFRFVGVEPAIVSYAQSAFRYFPHDCTGKAFAAYHPVLFHLLCIAVVRYGSMCCVS